MANITEEHLHHMARRHHATMQKLEGIKEKSTRFFTKSFSTLETAAGAWAGGLIEGRWGGAAIGPVPINLLAGAVLLAAGHVEWSGEFGKHFNNLGNGLIGSYLAATGYAFGKRWRDTGKPFGGGGHPYSQPYDLPGGWPSEAPAVHGDIPDAQMAAIVARMQAAARAPAMR